MKPLVIHSYSRALAFIRGSLKRQARNACQAVESPV